MKRSNYINVCIARFSKQTKTIGFYYTIFAFALLFSGCTKDGISTPNAQPAITSDAAVNSNAEFMSFYSGLSKQTSWELQQARAATARYRDLKNAFKDGYADIHVIVPNMGYHFMKSENLDDTFDPRNPEILVYNKNADGSWQLIAVEYAVPIALSPDNPPEGFSGDGDVWDRNTTFGLWLCHAWVWSYNPDGVFHDTNPLIEVH